MDLKEIIRNFTLCVDAIDNNHIVSTQIDVKMLENAMVKCVKPKLLIAKYSLGVFVNACGDFSRNRYAYKKSIGKYDLYGEMIDVEIEDISFRDSNGYDYVAVVDEVDEDNFFVIRCC